MKRILAVVCMTAFTGLACAAETCGLTSFDDFGWSYLHVDINDAGVMINTGTSDDGADTAASMWHRGVASPLPGLGGDHTSASAINNNGKVAGFAEDANGTYRPVTWTDGVLAELPLLPKAPPGRGGEANGLNDRRSVVGSSYASDGKVHAVLWVDGKANDLNRIIGSVSSTAYAINNKGQIIGSAFFGDHYEQFLYQGGTVQFLAEVNGNHIDARDINDNGQIVGNMHTQEGANRAFLWENGVLRDLGTLGGASSIAYGINIHGQVVGAADGPNGHSIAFSWKNGVMTRIGTLSDILYDEKSYGSAAFAVNANGRVVGMSEWFFRDTYNLAMSWHWKKRC